MLINRFQTLTFGYSGHTRDAMAKASSSPKWAFIKTRTKHRRETVIQDNDRNNAVIVLMIGPLLSMLSMLRGPTSEKSLTRTNG